MRPKKPLFVTQKRAKIMIIIILLRDNNNWMILDNVAMSEVPAEQLNTHRISNQ